MRGYVRPDVRAAVQADAIAARGTVSRDPAGVRAEVLRGVLCRDPALERRAGHLDAILGYAEVGQCGAGRDLELSLDDVDGGDLLGHRVLDLYAGVHLDEHVTAVGGDEELDGARVQVTDGSGEGDRVGPQPAPGWSGRGWVPGRSRPPSGGGVGPSSPVS